MAAKIEKDAPPPSVECIGKNTKLTTAPEAKRAAVAAVAAAGFARMLKSSEARTQNSPACEAENAVMKAEAAESRSAGRGGLSESAAARRASESEHAAPPQVASGLLPAASTSSSAAATPTTLAPLTAPERAVAAASEATPALSSSAGAKVTTAEEPMPWLAAATAMSNQKARRSGPAATARTSARVWESCLQKPGKARGGCLLSLREGRFAGGGGF